MRLVVVGDIHAQREKFWRILQRAGLTAAPGVATERLQDPDLQLVLLGDLVHAKSADRYGELIGVRRFDEYNPRHLRRAEAVQERFLREVMEFQASLPAGRLVILLGNHDQNAAHPDLGPLRSDDVTHLEWKAAYGGELPADLREWILGWPRELVREGIHLAHVGPLPQHNTYDNDFYLENRRRWIFEDRDWLEGTPYRLGVYGHTPVRGGPNFASRGRAVLLDANGHGDEYCFLEIEAAPGSYRLQIQGLFFDETVLRAD